MKSMKDVYNYLSNEQHIASADPASPEYQVFTSLLNLADRCNTVDEFLSEARDLPIEGPHGEVAEAEQWLSIALDTIEDE